MFASTWETMGRENSTAAQMMMCLEEIHVDKFSKEWEKNILNLLPRKKRKKHSSLIKSILEEVKNIYIKNMQEFTIRIIFATGNSNNNDTPFSDYDSLVNKEYKILKETGIVNCKKFSKNRSLFATKYFLSLEPIKIIIGMAQLKLPSVICDFEQYHHLGILTLDDFQSTITNDIKKSSLAITNQFYVETSKAIAQTKTLRSATPRRLSKIMRCITNIFVQQILNIMIKSIDHIINVMSCGHRCPRLKFMLVFEDGKLLIKPSIGTVFQTYHEIIERIENIAHNLIPLEEWLNIKTTCKYIKVKLPDWFVEQSHMKLQKILDELFQPMNDHLAHIAEEFRPVSTVTINKKFLSLSGSNNFDFYLKHIQTYNVFLTKASKVVANTYYAIGTLEQNEAKEALKQHCSNIINAYIAEVVKYHQQFNQRICAQFEELKTKALDVPKDAKSLIELSEYISGALKMLVKELKKKIQKSVHMLSALLEVTILTEEHIELNRTTINWLHNIEPVFLQNNTLTEAMKNELEDDMQKRINLLNSKVDGIVPQLSTLDDMDDIRRVQEYVEYYRGLLKQVKEIDREMQMINEEERLFKFPETEFPKVVELREIIMPFHTLIYTIRQWQRDNAVWLDGPFEWLDFGIIEKKTLNYFDQITEMSKTFKARIKMDITTNKCFKFTGIADDPDPMQQPAPLKLCWQALNDINEFKTYLPLVICMCNPALQKRHWDEMSAICDFDLTPNAGTSLKKIIGYDLMKDIEKYETISIGANRELALQQKLSRMIKEWDNISFEMNLCPESGAINFVNLDDIELLLGEHLTKIEEMRSSNFVKPITKEVSEFFTSLIRIQEIIEQWDYIQERKLSLCPIFAYPTIDTYLPKETTLYKEVEVFLLEIQEKVSNAPYFNDLNNSSLSESINDIIKKLEMVRKGVEDYIETKRQSFARFYFLTDREIQKLLFESNNTEKLAVFLQKCFTGVRKLRIRNNCISSIIGECDEVVHMSKIIPIHSSDSDDGWLIELENEINNAISKKIMEYYNIFDAESICDNILSFPSMAIICVFQMYWTSNVHSCLTPYDRTLLKSLETRHMDYLSCLINEIKNCSTRKYRSILTTLVFIIANRTEIISLLLNKNITQSTDFEWIAQLRYYLDDSRIKVSIFNTSLNYGYEYCYFKQYIISNALTDRCFHTLMQAYEYHLYGAIMGSSGTGKTETIKSLAQAIATQFYIFNCNTTVCYNFLSQIFKGFCVCGAWLCFENFDKLKIEVLSAISQRIIHISQSVSAKLNSIVFDGSTFNLNSSGHICVIINSGLSGYSKLPDNLKTIFRIVSMLVPDFRKIAEIQLLAAGFSDIASLALKLDTLYKLLSEQLWCTLCKDFGLCSLKNVIKSTTYLKRSFPDENESMLLLRSLIDINISKLCDTDVLIFKNIIHDIFPDVVLLPPNYTMLLESLENVCKTRSLCLHDVFKLKIIQVYELLSVHQALMLISDPYGGKTEILHTLVDVLSSLYKQGNRMGANIKLETITPGVTDSSKLFGRVDSKSGIWIDGICSEIFRILLEDNTCDKNWVVFDGPLHNAWIENLYTVLDTNKVLCTTSGERIHIVDRLSIIFETMDITEASPAILSRCGIVYIETQSIDWKPYVVSHISKHSIYDGYDKILYSLFDWTIGPCLQFIQKNCDLTVTVGRMHLLMTTLNLFEILLNDACTEDTEEKGKMSHFVIWAQAALILSIAWGLGGNLSLDSHVKFNTFCMSLWSGTNRDFPKPEPVKHFDITLPTEGLIQDNFYIFKGIGNWKYWGDLLKNEKIVETHHHNEVFVPTINTMKYNHLFLKHIKYRKPFALCGDIAIGKTFLMKNLLRNKLLESEYLCNFFSFTSLDTVKRMQPLLLSKLNKIKRRYFGPPKNQFCINFIDDLNVGFDEANSGVESTLELLRQYLNYGHFYDENEPKKIFVDNVMFALAITVQKQNNNICSRFLRHFNVYTIYMQETDTIFRIFSNVLFTNWKKNLFNADVLSSVNSITNATIDLYNTISKTLRPIPAKFQYCFNMRDICRVITGCSLLHKESVETKVTFIRLWVHETWRVFGDRMWDKDDKEYLFQKIKETVKAHFKDSFETAFDYLPKFGNQITKDSFDDLIFGNLLDSDKGIKNGKYEEINSIETLRNKVVSCLTEYNSNFKKHIEIVASHCILECVIRVSRILATPGSNLLLISSAGCGRRSIVNLAAYMQQQKLFEPSVHSYYDLQIWKDDLKTVLYECGGLKKDLTFFLLDKQMKNIFLRDINSLLATGEIPDLFSTDDTQKIIETIRLDAQSGNRNAEISTRAVMNYFIEQCKTKLHMVLCFSPTNKTFRSCFYPHANIMKYCTMNWYGTWPGDALLQIGNKFVQDVKIQDDIKPDTVKACIKFYECVTEMSTKHFEETGRVTYVTPSAYLHMLKLYARLMSKKQKDIIATRNRYLAGLEKLELAAQQVEQMKTTLTILKPQLELSAQQTMITMKEVENENVTVEKATILVKEEEEVANKKAEIAGTLKIECEADLAVAIPILEDAVAALNTLKPTDITLVKAMKNPPDTVKLVMAAVCVMLSVLPDRTIDPVTGKKYTDYWGPSKRILGDMNFLQNLKEYDKDNIPPAVMQVIKKTYMTDNSFMPHIVAKASSAAEGLCKWVRAMVSYDEVAKVVAPKKEKLLAAQRECDEAEAFLNEKRRTLSALNAKLAALNNSLQETLQQKLKLEKEVENCTNKLNKAENLIASLGGEKNRWVQCAEDLQADYDNLVGDMILSCGVIAYMAPYSSVFRNNTLERLKEYIHDLKIPHTKEYNFVGALGAENQINKWYFCGLPKNRFSTENAIIMNNSELSCLFIDSQNQANSWIKKIERRNKLKVVKLTHPGCMSIIQHCVENGTPILIENVREKLEIFLDPFLLKRIYKEDETWYLDTGRDIIKYSHDFRLYITTRFLNPVYSYEIFGKLTIIDFSIPNEALQDRLLNIVISKEKPELQEKFEELLIQDATNKKILKQQEDNILTTLSSTTTNILEDENAIKILDSSKNLSLDVIKKQERAKLMTAEINQFRDTYIQFVKHCAGLFSTLNALSNLNHMYRFSFSWFIQLYIKSIETSNRSVVLEKRLGFLKTSFTQNLHMSVCRSLSEKHKILYSFLLCSKILLDNAQATEEEIKFFLSPNISKSDLTFNSGPAWLPSNVWEKICSVSISLPAFRNLADDFCNNEQSWKEYYNSESPQDELIPKPLCNQLSEFQKLILVQIIRPDKIVIQIIQLITGTMGDTLNSSPQLKIPQSYAESSCLIPLIFILPSCSSPLSLVSAYASAKGYLSKLATISMGENQEQKAEFLIKEAQREGGWVFLQNCHLATNWMVQLERICENCNASTVSLDFRLWISSYPTNEFPISILQNSIKISYDYPLNLKQNLLNIYQSEPVGTKQFFEGCPGKDKVFSKFLFGICFFHIATMERRYFGIQGWNVPYNFDHFDLQISITQLKDLINNTDYVPFDTLLYLVGECNYGGKIIDHFDQRCLTTLLNYYCNPNIIKDRQYTFSSDIEHIIPQRCEYLHVIKHIQDMPSDLSPQIFGSNKNGIITRDTIIATEFMSSLSSINQIVVSTDKTSMHDQVKKTIDDIFEKLPNLFENNELQEKYERSAPKPLDRVVLHEIQLLNQTLKLIHNSLNSLKAAFDGYSHLSVSLEEMITDIYNFKVPHNWKKLPSGIVHEHLSDYFNNLLKRVEFIKGWQNEGCPRIIFFDALSSCKMFLSAALLTFAKHHKIPIEEVFLEFEVMSKEYKADKDDVDTYFLQGLHLCGARWDIEKNMLAESFTNVFWQEMPPIRFRCSKTNVILRDTYKCPVYTAAICHNRDNFKMNINELNNYITCIPLRTDGPEAHWIKCGTALFCQIP